MTGMAEDSTFSDVPFTHDPWVASRERYKGFNEYLKKKFGIELELFLAPPFSNKKGILLFS